MFQERTSCYHAGVTYKKKDHVEVVFFYMAWLYVQFANFYYCDLILKMLK